MPLSKPSRSRLVIGVALVIAITVVGVLAWGFGQQLALAQEMRAEEIRLEQAVAAKQARYDDLVAQLEYVKSDEYVEHWARTDPVMTKPGEVAIVLVTDADEEPASDVQPTPPAEPEERPFWVELWELVFRPTENP